MNTANACWPKNRSRCPASPSPKLAASTPANLLPNAAPRNQMPSIAPTKCRGASFVKVLNPTGLRHISPIVCSRYRPSSHSGLTRPSAARRAAGIIRLKPSAREKRPSVNFIGLDG